MKTKHLDSRRAVTPEMLLVQAVEAERAYEAARQMTKLAKQHFKLARKHCKQARKQAKEARKRAEKAFTSRKGGKHHVQQRLASLEKKGRGPAKSVALSRRRQADPPQRRSPSDSSNGRQEKPNAVNCL